MGKEKNQGQEKRGIIFSISNMAIMACIVLSFALLISKGYNGEYGITEYYAKDALENAGLEEAGNLCVTDCYQQYLLKFYYDIECENQNIEEADTILLHKEMTMPETGKFRWEFYQTYDTIPWNWLEGQRKPVYENEEYIVYK